MTHQTTAIRVLVILYRSASRGRFPTESELARQVGLDVSDLSPVLGSLDRSGLLDVAGLRLTLSGLAVAVAASKKQNIKPLARAA